MPARDNLYSRVIGLLKVVLPLAALGILSTVFLLSRPGRFTPSIPFTEAELRERIANPGVTAPYFAGNTEDGASVVVTAATIRPEGSNEGRATAVDLNVQVDMPSTERLTLSAETGLMDQDADTARLTGGVKVTSSQGYELMTDALTASLSRVEGASDGPVTGTGPAGDLAAGKLEIGPDPETGATTLRFTNGVKLLYRPKPSTE